MPNALRRIAKGMSFVMVFIRQWIRGPDLSYFTITLKTEGRAAIPRGTERIYVIQGVLYYFVLKVYTKLKAIRYWPTTTFYEPRMMK